MTNCDLILPLVVSVSSTPYWSTYQTTHSTHYSQHSSTYSQHVPLVHGVNYTPNMPGSGAGLHPPQPLVPQHSAVMVCANFLLDAL